MLKLNTDEFSDNMFSTDSGESGELFFQFVCYIWKCQMLLYHDTPQQFVIESETTTGTTRTKAGRVFTYRWHVYFHGMGRAFHLFMSL
jgi:hypothetical protein